MEKKYTIAELEWSESQASSGEYFYINAGTPFGTYSIEADSSTTKWRYCFDEYYDEEEFECESVEAGKAEAWNHWNERLSSALNPA